MEELLLSTPKEKEEKKGAKQWVKYILLFLTIVFTAISIVAVFHIKKTSCLPDNVIGYSDRPTEILAIGTPVPLYVLFGLTILLGGTTLFIFFRRK